ncbi:MAG: citramalate synthase [Acidobacteriota bacterium]|nr:citramalate synthase [Acidobacteriota bacterium]
MRIQTFDTTLRDGTQGEAVSFSVEDKILISQKLDELGIDYIEGGWPGSNPKDREFFLRARNLKLRHAKLTAFGSTRMAKNSVEEDRNVRELVEAGTPAVAIFGKSWDYHVTRALGITLEENLKLISETVAYLKQHGKEVIYDAEHFFDGYIHNREYALQTLEAAKKAGADVLCLCDTNGGTMTERLAEVVADVRSKFEGVIGIHAHNDSDVAVANTLAAVQEGAEHVQGCLNGYGERCGNANLASAIANLELKLGHQTIGPDRLQKLTSTARYIADLANLQIARGQAFVGPSAFAHKGGIHVSAVMKDSSTYEHISPDLVGNRQRVLVSDLSGRSNVDYLLRDYADLAGRLSPEARRKLVDRVKEAEYLGYDLEAADGTFELYIRQALNQGAQFFEVHGYEVMIVGGRERQTRATATVRIGTRGGDNIETAHGHGPVNALDTCLRKCLSALPGISGVRLTDYKVRVLDSGKGTAAKVRVLVEWSDGNRSWSTVGVSEDVIEASWEAMVTALQLELMRLLDSAGEIEAVSEYCWTA